MAESNVKIISQRTGEFIEADAAEPGYVVNMDDQHAQAFIDRIKGANPTPTAADVQPAKHQPLVVDDANTASVAPLKGNSKPGK